MVSLLLPLLGALTVLPASPQDTAHVVIVATTDVHGRVVDWDYVTEREAPWGLTRAATAVDSLRRRYPGRVVLVDAGDLIQGNVFAAYFASVQPVVPHPIIDAMNALGYDAGTLGNHEFNWGLDVLTRAVGDAAYPIVSGNIFRLPRDTFAYQPYAVLPRAGVRVGITGFTTPGVMVWDRGRVGTSIVVRPIIPEARRVMEALSALADFKIVLIHSGMGAPSTYDTTGIGPENVAAELASLPVKPDLVVVGHSHRRMTDSVINGVHFIQPEAWARSLAIAHVSLARAPNGRFRVVRIRGEQLPLATVPPSPAMTRRVAATHERVRSWASLPIATLEGDWSARVARTEDTPLIDFVNEVQRRTAGAQLSSTAVFDPSAGFGPGPVRLRDLAGVYPYENRLVAVRIAGATLQAYLERSAAYFRTYTPAGPVINDSIAGYNYDIVHGVNYIIDLSQPVGARIRELTYQGRLVQATDTFTLALNDYRQGGGGGYAMLARLPVVYDRGENIRDLLVDVVRSTGTLRAADYATVSWRILPPEAAAAARQVFAPAGPSRDSTILRVLGTNDVHGALASRMQSAEGGRAAGGLAAIKAWMDSLAGACRCVTVRLDGGDIMQGSPESNFFFGRAMVEAFNLIGYDAAAIGNHEFDWGVDTLQARIRDARFAWLAANLYERGTDRRPSWARPWTMIERGGLRIAVIGAITTSTPTTTMPGNVAAFEFRPIHEAVRGLLPEIRTMRPDFVVLVAHEGAECDGSRCQGEIMDVARALDSASIDLIVGGHRHRVVQTVVNGIPIVQAGSFGANVDVVDFVRRADGRREVRARIEPAWSDAVLPDSAVTALVARYQRDTERITTRPIAQLKFALARRGDQYPLGNLIADAQRNAARADVAIMNNGGIRSNLPQGTVTFGDLFTVQPFGNVLQRLTVSGDVLYAALEHLIAAGGPIGHVSGIEVRFDPARPAGRRIRRVQFPDGREARRDRSYTLAVTDFLATGGSGFDMFKGLPAERVGVDLDALIAYLRLLPQPVDAPEAVRIQLDR